MGPKNTSGYRLFLLSILAIALSACGGGGGSEGGGSGSSSGGGSGSAVEIRFFAANDGTNGTELWKTDGTAAGTVVVKNFNPTAGGVCSILSVFTEFNGALYFNANDGVQGSQQGEHGSELWKSDGTAAGTVLVKDIAPVAAASPSPDSSLFVLNGALYFKATDGVSGIELWKSDGSAAGTQLLKDICPGACGGTTGF